MLSHQVFRAWGTIKSQQLEVLIFAHLDNRQDSGSVVSNCEEQDVPRGKISFGFVRFGLFALVDGLNNDRGVVFEFSVKSLGFLHALEARWVDAGDSEIDKGGYL